MADVTLPPSAYYPKPATPIDVNTHPTNNFTPMQRIQGAFSALVEGDFEKKKAGMDDSGR